MLKESLNRRELLKECLDRRDLLKEDPGGRLLSLIGVCVSRSFGLLVCKSISQSQYGT
jgi:hypothetical protein